MRKILNIKHSIATFDNFVDPKDCKKLIEIFEKQKDTKAYTRLDGEGVPKAAKDDVAITFSKDNNWPKEIHSMCKHLTEALGEYIKVTDFINLTSASDLHFTNIKIQKTKPGGGYHVWHVERSHESFSCKRALVWTMYLNDVKKGGETEFLNQNERIEPKAGRICIFPADFPYVHRGNPPLQEDKYILTSWFLST
tara:strand:+ start:2503 stop:3087 length:585 start_codon:yes stop_codon:yes gene_type:complete